MATYGLLLASTPMPGYTCKTSNPIVKPILHKSALQHPHAKEHVLPPCGWGGRGWARTGASFSGGRIGSRAVLVGVFVGWLGNLNSPCKAAVHEWLDWE